MLLELTALTIGLHMGTMHSEPGLNSTNPGLYVKTEAGWTAGGYFNSFRRPSLYVGKTFETENKTWALTVGAVTGYSDVKASQVTYSHCHVVESIDPNTGRVGVLCSRDAIGRGSNSIRPMIVPSVRVPIQGDYALRMTFVPRVEKGRSNAISFAIERKF